MCHRHKNGVSSPSVMVRAAIVSSASEDDGCPHNGLEDAVVTWINCALYFFHSVHIAPGRQTSDFVLSFKVDDRAWRKPQRLFFSDLDTQDYENIDLAQTTAVSVWAITCRRHFVRGLEKRDSQLCNWHFGLMRTDTCTFRLLQNERLNIFHS